MRAIKTLFILGWKLLHHFLEYRHATTYLKQSTKWEDQVFAFKCCKMIDIPLIQIQNVHSKVYFGQYLKWPSIKYVRKIMAKFDPLPLSHINFTWIVRPPPLPTYLQTTPGEKWVMMDIGDRTWGKVYIIWMCLGTYLFWSLQSEHPLQEVKRAIELCLMASKLKKGWVGAENNQNRTQLHAI